MAQILRLLLLVFILRIRYLIYLVAKGHAHGREADDRQANLQLLQELEPFRLILRYQLHRALLEVMEKQVRRALPQQGDDGGDHCVRHPAECVRLNQIVEED